jgi:hypothetical protein
MFTVYRKPFVRGCALHSALTEYNGELRILPDHPGEKNTILWEVTDAGIG